MTGPFLPNQDAIANYSAVEQLRNRCCVTIRAIRPDDKKRLQAAFQGLEQSSIRQRFFAPKKELTDQELTRATELDFMHHVALVACVQQAAEERIIGVGRYIALNGSSPPSAAEVAFVVEEDYHRQGVASMLLKHLVSIGRQQGVSRFEAEVLPGNRAMLRVFERAGLRVDTRPSSDSVRVTMFLHPGGAT